MTAAGSRPFDPRPSGGVPALQFDSVVRDFQTPAGDTYRALDDISFAVPAGAFVAIVGPSGCGKSTLLNIAAGLLAPTSGRVRVDNADLSALNRSATYMFQQDALLPWKTVRDNVALGLTLAGSRRADATTKADAWLSRVGLAEFAAHYPAQLSGGMRKRVAMAQNWIVDRTMVLMDEPFSALDVHTRQRMETELLTLWESAGDAGQARARKTIVFVTHDLEEAIVLADDVVVLSAGPASHVVARHAVTLERPRDLLDLRTTPAFIDLYRSIWAVLRKEVVRSQTGPVKGRG
jgi:NitT/TauT family transport system ATP-binding protein